MSFLARAAAAAASSMFGFFNTKPAPSAKNEQIIKDAIEQDKLEINPEAIEKAEKAEDGSSLTKNEDNVILQVLQEENHEKEALGRKIEESMQDFIKAQGDITAFREECISEAVKQFQEALRTYDIKVADETSGAIMGKIAGSWSELLISSTQGDSSIYLSMKTFFFRVNQAIDALLTQCIFLSTKWRDMQTALSVTCPSLSLSLPDLSSRKVNVGPCWYIVGPILDFQNIEGRIFIYVKCYSDETNGIYFWVYGSQSEGFNRVFFKLDPFGSIEKGFDYTQGTFVHLRLQMALCNYYKTHRGETPKLLDTLTELNSFMSSMPYLQQAIEKKDVHLYKIDDSFASIIKRGFPLHPPSLTNSDWLHVVNMICKKKGPDVNLNDKLEIAKELQKQWDDRDYGRKLFPRDANDTTNQFYDFSRIKMGYGTTCPYIFCFTTCGLVQSCPMFKLFLSANSYKTTFWCQGFQNYTEMLSVDPNRKILSPVLHVVIGALLQDADMRLSTLRNIILNIGIMSDARLMSQEFYKATKALMTLGTRNFGDPDTSTRMPGAPPSRLVATLALNPQGLRFIPGSHRNIKNDDSLDAIIKEKVDKKIKMIEWLAKIYKNTKLLNPNSPFVLELDNLLSHLPDNSGSHTVPDNSEKVEEDIVARAAANAFITASPEAAAAALFGYISIPKKHENEPTEFEKDLTDLAHVCLKQAWISGMMNDAYHAVQGVFNRDNAIYNYLGIDGRFYEFDPAAPPPLPAPAAPPAPPAPYVFISSFDEVRKEDTSPTNPDKNEDNTTKELNVTVVTFAHIYRVDCGYHEVFANGDILLKSMSILYQISTTVVYTRENPSRILYAVTHRTPLACLPDLPDALEYLIPKFSKTTGHLGDTKPVTEPVRKAEYTNNPLNRPGEKKAEVIAREARLNKEKLMVLNRKPNVMEDVMEGGAPAAAEELLTSPYTLCATYKRVTSYGALFAGKMMEYFFGGSNGYYQLPYFFRNFDKFLKVCHQYDSTVLMYLPEISPYNLLSPLPNAQPLLDASIQPYFTGLGITFQGDSIGTKLEKNTKDIQAIFKFLTGDFMVDPGILDDVSTVSDSQGTTSSMDSTSSMSSTSSYAIDYFLFTPLEKNDNQSGNESLQDPSWSLSSQDAGTLPIKNHIKKSITTRKNKNKPRTNSRTPVRRVTIRIKRLMKSKVTKPKTYKRRATGGKRKSKPNKTMRRYRRVRK